MSKTILLLPIALALLCGLLGLLRKAGAQEDEDRVAAARVKCEATIRARFRTTGLAYPPGEIFLRALKKEGELELWARAKNEPFQKIATYLLTATSGGPGPKRREGDRQIPEGCYLIDVFNPKSRFHLSLGLNYPNASDRILSNPTRPGGEIYIHGNALSIGCLAIGDPAIEEIYLIALDARAGGQAEIPVHIFPARMSGPGWSEFATAQSANQPELRAFWDNLQPVYERFEREKKLPEISVAPDGSYRLAR